VAPANSDPDLATRVLKLERTVRSIGEVLAAGLALGPASIAYQIADRLGFSGWVGGLVAFVVWGAAGSAFWKWYGHDLRP
jgi:ABC-type Mn2+/Zn2+ transport system permease subunit